MLSANRLLRTRQLIWYTMVCVVIVVALAMIVLRMVTPWANHYREHIADQLSQAIGHKVTIGTVRAVWHGLGPSIQLKDVRVLSQQQDRIIVNANDIRLQYSLIASLLQWQWLPRTLRVQGIQIDLEYTAAGQLVLPDETAYQPVQQALGTYIQLLERWPESDFHHMSLRITERATQSHYTLSDVSVQFGVQHGKRRLNVSVLDADEHQTQAALHVIFEPMNGGVFSGKAHLRLDAFQLGHAFFVNPWLRAPLSGGTLDMETWISFSEGALQTAQARYALQRLAFAHPPTALARKPISSSGHLLWSRQNAHAWRLQGDEIKLFAENSIIENSQLKLDVTRQHEQKRFALTVDAVDLGGLYPLVRNSRLLPDPYAHNLQQLDMTGKAQNITLSLTTQNNNIVHYDFYTDFVSTQLNLQRSVVIAPLQGHLRLADKRGKLTVTTPTHGLRVNQASQQMPLTQLGLAVRWQRDALGWQVTGDSILSGENDLKLITRLRVMPNAIGTSDIIVKAHLAEAHFHTLRPFITMLSPHNQQLTAWLQHGLVTGTLTDTALNLHCAWHALQANTCSNIQLRSRLSDATIRYARAWPRLEKLDADIHFNGRDLTAYVHKAKLDQANVMPSSVTIPALLSAEDKHIHVHGEFNGTLTQVNNFIAHSPLRNSIGKRTAPLALSGPMQLTLDYRDSLTTEHALSVKGVVRTKNAEAVLKHVGLRFTHLTGEARFTEQGFYADALSTNFLGVPMQIRIDTLKNAKKKALQVTLNSRLTAAMLKMYVPADWSRAVHGSTAYTAVLTEDNHTGNLALQMKSQLDGLSVDLPYPMHKSSQQKKAIDLRLTWLPHARLGLTVDYAKTLRAQVQLTKQQKPSVWQLVHGHIHFGDSETPFVLPEKGLLVSGHLEQLDLDAWSKQWMPFEHHAPGPLALTSLAIDVKQLTAFRQRFGAINMKMTKQAHDWLLTLKGGALEGTILIPQQSGGQALVARLQRCYLHAVPPSSSQGLLPENLPILDVTCAHLRYHGRQLGALQLNTYRKTDNALDGTVTLTSKAYKAALSGHWSYEKAHGHQSHVTGVVNFKRAEHLFRALGQPVELVSHDGKIEMALSWPRAIPAFGVKELDGKLSISINDGRILDIDPGMGKFISVLSLHNIGRRLALDFSDVFAQGFTFDYLKGDFTLSRGMASTNNLTMDSSSAFIQIDGTTDLVKEQIDARLRVSPHVTGTLPLAAAVATGNPAVGALLWVVDKVFTNQINEISQYTYRVSGSWHKPVIK